MVYVPMLSVCWIEDANRFQKIRNSPRIRPSWMEIRIVRSGFDRVELYFYYIFYLDYIYVRSFLQDCY